VLLEELIIRSEKKWHPKNIYLHVVSVNKKAIQLYQSLGFQIIAQLPQWFEYNKKYLDEYLLTFDKERFIQKQKKAEKNAFIRGLKKDNRLISQCSPSGHQSTPPLVSESQP